MVQNTGAEVLAMKIGYIRVSTKDQNLARQHEQMQELEVDKVFEEKVSGKNIKDRPQFTKALAYARQGDTFVVTSLDRLGRNYEDIKSVVQQLKDKGVRLEVLDASFLNFNTGNDLLDTAMTDMFLSLLSYIAQNERDKIRERQAQGIELAKARGVYKGGQAVYSATSSNPQKRVIYELIIQKYHAKVPVRQIAKETGVSRNTVYRIIKPLQEVNN